MIINDIPSSCRSQNCSFNYSTAATPLVTSVTPLSGQEGTNVVLNGSGFLGNNSGEGVRVWLGEAECVVTEVREDMVNCTVQPHSAGQVRVRVHIPGSGYAVINDSVCFTYQLSLMGSLPTEGGTLGGTQVTIFGFGFLPVIPLNSAHIGSPLDSTAWLGPGFGWPQILPLLPSLCPSLTEQYFDTDSHLMPSEDRPLRQLLMDSYEQNATKMDMGNMEQLQALITALYLELPMSVFIGSAPCVITSASLDQLNCTTTSHYDTTANITVNVLGEIAVLENGYQYDDNLTPTITSVTPSSGPVYGGTLLTITGEVLDDTISVSIGDAPCTITFSNSTNVECTTTSHAPSSLPISLSTGQGVARMAAEGSGQDMPFFFTYELEVNSVGPLMGSVNGGQRITIEGRGFHPTLTKVFIGSQKAYVVSANDNEVVCLTPPPTDRHTVAFVDGGYNTGELCRGNNYTMYLLTSSHAIMCIVHYVIYAYSITLMALSYSFSHRNWVPVFLVIIRYRGTAWGHHRLGMGAGFSWYHSQCLSNPGIWFQYEIEWRVCQ